jgi:general stress protein 26
MKSKFNFLRYLITVIFLISPAEFCFSQDVESSHFSRDSILTAAGEIIEATRYCALITTDSAGVIHVRSMDPFPPEDELVIWFGTNKYSRKIKEIRKNPGVTLYYAHPKGSGYVVISGRAEIIDDKEEKSKRWKDEWAQFYTDREKNYVLIKVVPQKMEVINYSLGIGNDPKTWKVPSIEF